MEGMPRASAGSLWTAGVDLPAKHVSNTLQSAEFWTNKVLLADRSAPSQEWVKALKDLLKGLAAYLKQHHAAGPAWNPNGLPLSQYTPGAQTSSGECSAHPLGTNCRRTMCARATAAVWPREGLCLAQHCKHC